MRGKYILDGHAVVVEPDLLKWADWFETADRHVRIDTVRAASGRAVCVSTVFLGLDHSFGSNGKPVVFETMIFNGPLDDKTWRYATWEDAERGHAVALELAKAAQEELEAPWWQKCWNRVARFFQRIES